ncbi:MAG TPA: hypothetical protein VNT29_06615 [Candidatus Limnocylindrales bacterium]|nr:hypothetical protein [Candidatus Limnocylindrales bacterium]
MANTKVSGMTAAGASVAHDSLVPVVESGVNKKPSLAVLLVRALSPYTGASNTPVLADQTKCITTSHTAATALTIPPNSGVAYPVGTLLVGDNIGAGTLTLTAGGGVTLNGFLEVQPNGTWFARKIDTDTWDVWSSTTAFARQMFALTGASNTLAASHAGKVGTVSHTATATVTVPPNSSVAYPINTEITLVQIGAGQLTLAQGAGVTIRTAETLLARKQWSWLTIKKVATDEWYLTGDIQLA